MWKFITDGILFDYYAIITEYRFDESSNLEKYPSWPKGHPWKGCRSLIAARGFKSLLLRFVYAKVICRFLILRSKKKVLEFVIIQYS